MFAWQATVQDEQGNAVPLPVVTVWESDGVSLASIFDEDGVSLPNPLTGTMEGFVQFWARSGEYKIEGASGPDFTETWVVSGGILEVDDFSDLAGVKPESIPVGGMVRAASIGSVYVRVASGGDIDFTSSGGVHLRVAHDGVVHPVAFGVTAGGAVDAAVALTAALNSSALVIDGGGLTYRADTTLSMPEGKTLRNIVLDFSNFPGVGAKNFLTATGAGVVDTASVPGDVLEGTFSVTVASGEGSKFAAGDYVQITSEETYDYTGATVKRGEIKRVRSVAGDVIRFRDAVYEGYLIANGAINLRKLSLIENVTLDNVRIIGTPDPVGNQRGIVATWTKGLRVMNCTFERIDTYCCALFDCVEYDVSHNRFEGVYYLDVGSSFYAVAIFNCCQWGVMLGNIGEEVRHLITISSSAARYGQPYHYTVTGNIMHNAMAGGATDSWAYENHGFGRWGTWVGNVADGCRVGFNLEKGDQVVSGNIVKNYSYYGLYFDDSGQALINVRVDGNLFVGPSEVSGGSSRVGIRVESEAASARRNISISNNTIVHRATSSVADIGIFVGVGSGTAINCSIEGNTITNENPGYETSDFAIRLEQAGWNVGRNKIRDFGRAVWTVADTTIQGNEVRLTTQGAAGSAVEITGSNCVVNSNVFRNVFRAISVSSGSDGTRISGNVQINSASATVLNNGTNTVFDLQGGGF